MTVSNDYYMYESTGSSASSSIFRKLGLLLPTTCPFPIVFVRLPPLPMWPFTRLIWCAIVGTTPGGDDSKSSTRLLSTGRLRAPVPLRCSCGYSLPVLMLVIAVLLPDPLFRLATSCCVFVSIIFSNSFCTLGLSVSPSTLKQLILIKIKLWCGEYILI